MKITSTRNTVTPTADEDMGVVAGA